MYLSKAQINGLRDIGKGRHTVLRPELVAFFLDNGLIYEELLGWRTTEKASEWLAETIREHEQLQADFSTNKFTTGRRESFSNSDGPIVERKHKDPFSYGRRVETKYKEIK